MAARESDARSEHHGGTERRHSANLSRRSFIQTAALTASIPGSAGCSRKEKPELSTLTGRLRSAARVSLPRLGGSLPQDLDLGQSRPLHAFRELHRLLLLERLRAQRRDGSRGAGRRLPAHQRRSARLQSARLPEGRLLRRIRLQPAAAALSADPHRRARRGQVAPAPPGTKRSPWSPTNCSTTSINYGPDTNTFFSVIPAMSPVSFCAGSRLAHYIGGVFLLLLRLVLRPAAGRAADLGRADRGLRVRRLVQLEVHRALGHRISRRPASPTPTSPGKRATTAPRSSASRRTTTSSAIHADLYLPNQSRHRRRWLWVSPSYSSTRI